MFNELFWKDTLERVIVTFAESMVGTLTVVAMAAGGLSDVVWGVSLGAAGLAALIAFFKSLAALKFTDGNSASLVIDNITEKESK